MKPNPDNKTMGYLFTLTYISASKVSNKTNHATLVTHFGAGKKVARIFRQVPSAMALPLRLFRHRVAGLTAGQHGVGGSLRDADVRYVPSRHGQQQRYEPQSHQLCAHGTRKRVKLYFAYGRQQR